VKLSILAAALTVALATPSFAQTQQPPAKPTTPLGQPPAKPTTPLGQPPATTPPAGQQPAAPKPAAPTPPVPFPQDAKYAVVDVQAIAQNSTAGKDASKKLNDLQAKKMGEIQDKNKQLQALQAKQQASGVLSETAKASLDKEIDRLQRDIQFSQSNAQAEMTDLNNELQAEFTKKVAPIIEEIAKEKGLYLVFTADSGFAYVHPGLNISDEVIKRLDSKKDDTKKD
jgi:Skp family chaperone for outer membrane proteins